jgi:hypothetical protein
MNELEEKRENEEKIKDIVYPRFRTQDYEASTTRARNRHFIKSVEFGPDTRQGYPTGASGYVWVGISQMKIDWDKRGRAFNFRGLRVPNFDLIRPEEKEIEAARNVAGALMGVILVIVIGSFF